MIALFFVFLVLVWICPRPSPGAVMVSALFYGNFLHSPAGGCLSARAQYPSSGQHNTFVHPRTCYSSSSSPSFSSSSSPFYFSVSQQQKELSKIHWCQKKTNFRRPFSYLRGSHGLSAHRARRTKPRSPKGLQFLLL